LTFADDLGDELDSRASAASQNSKGLFKREQVDAAGGQLVVDQTTKPCGTQHGGQIDRCAFRGGDGDAVDDGEMLGWQQPSLVDHHTFETVVMAVGPEDVNVTLRRREIREPVDSTGGDVARPRARAGEHCRDCVASPAVWATGDGDDVAM